MDIGCFNVKDFGAAGDGVSQDTDSIQAAIDACEANHGGTVVFPKGIYYTGTLFLKDNVTLYLLPEAEIRGSKDISMYANTIQGCIEAPDFDKCLIYAFNKKNITICGKGTINGQGDKAAFPGISITGEIEERPMLMRFIGCSNITFNEITLKNAASWCCHMVECSEVKVEGIRLINRVNHNNDGFDLDSCSNVFFSNCNISSIDDSICLKSTRQNPCNHIVINNCIITSDTAAVKFGTSSKAGFKNISISNCVFYDCKLGAIKLIVVDGGILENVNISNITMENVGGPVFIRLGNRGMRFEEPQHMNYGAPRENKGKSIAGGIRNIIISNIIAKVGNTDMDKCGMLITGISGNYVENVTLSNIQITFPGGGTQSDAERDIAEDEARYPEQWFFGVLPAYGLFLRHAKGIKIDNVMFYLDAPDMRAAIVCNDVSNLKITNTNFNCSIEKI